MNIKAIALDMDGTLLDSSNRIHENLISTLNKLRQSGLKIFLATGRTRLEIEEIIPADFPYDGAVTSNGMGCYIIEREVFQNYLDKELVEKVIQIARDHRVYYEIHSAEGERQALAQDKKMMKQEVEDNPPASLKANEIYSRRLAIDESITWVDELDYSGIVKIYFFAMQQEKIINWKKRLEELKVSDHFSTSSSSLHNVEIMKDGISKATGLTQLLDQFNLLPEELMAIGDGENDLPMFELCSVPVAMNNAPDNVKNKAAITTKESYDNHGLNVFLNEQFLSNRV